jgi:hypothetical protein
MILLLTFLVSATTKISAQLNPSLDNYSISQSNGQVYIYWVLSAGFTCDGIRVFRGADSLMFHQVGRIPGICGSPDFAVAFDFTDSNPVLNAVNYYRLELGNFGFTSVIAIYVVDFKDKGYLLFPNPAHAEVKIEFENPGFSNHKLEVFNLNGGLVYQAESNETNFVLNTINWRAGMYVFIIVDELNERVIRGLLSVVR